jgi:hypothetical protein
MALFGRAQVIPRHRVKPGAVRGPIPIRRAFSEQAEGGAPMISYSTEPNSPVVELVVEGKVTDADLRANIERLCDDLERNGKTRILEVINHFTGMEPQALWTDLKRGLPLAQKVNRVAVVADQAWIRTVSHLGRFFTSAELKIFAPAELDQARAWIAKP